MKNEKFLTECPSADELLSILRNAPELPADDPLLMHLESCPDCQAAMDELIGPVKNEHTFEAVRTTIVDLMSYRDNGQAAATPAPNPQTPATRVPGFRIVESIGQGGSGVVFKAVEIETGDVVALKWLPFSSQGDFVSAGKELAAAKLLDHPGIVKLVRQVQWNGQTAIVMNWIDGSNLQEILDSRKLSIAESVDLAIRICEILEYAHGRGLIHRDLKPSNIMLAGGNIEDPRLADFGLAKFEGPQGRYSTATIGVGTPGYMPPELVSADFGPVCQATDIYSLGVILHELLTGELPFEGKTHFDSLRKTCDEPVRPLRRRSSEIPVDLETICMKCLAKRQPDRYATANQLRLDLERFRDGKPILARRVSRVELVKDWARRNPAVALISSGSFCMLLAGVALLAVLLERSRRSQEASEKSLKAAVSAMSNAAPVFKRFTQIVTPNEDEREKLRRAAEECLKIGDETSDFRVRCDAYFNALQMATAMRNQPGLLKFAESIARSTIEKFRTFKAREESPLRAKNLKPEAIDPITALDLVNIRLGYSLIELAYITELKGPAHVADYENLLDQTIAQCETTLAENPTLEEVHFMLGGTFYSKSEIHLTRENIPQGVRYLNESVKNHRIFYDYEPTDIVRNMSYLRALWFHLALKQETGDPDGLSREYVGEILREICELKRLRPEGWDTLALMRIKDIGQLIVVEFDRSDRAMTEAVIDEFLDLIHEIAGDPANDAKIGGVFFDAWFETICQLQARGRSEDAANESQRMLTWIASLKNPDRVNSYLSEIRLLSPLPAFRSRDQVLQIFVTAAQAGTAPPISPETVELLKGRPVDQLRQNPKLHRYSNFYSSYVGNEILNMLYRDPADWPDESIKRFASILNDHARNPLVLRMRHQCLIKEIQERAQAANRPIPRMEEAPAAANSAQSQTRR